MTRTRALTFIVVLQLLVMGWLAWKVTTTASGVRAVAHEALALAQTQRTDREQAILRLCRDQNHRHRVTDRDLDRLYKPVERRVHTAAQRRQLRASRRSTLLLIGALAPLQNCQQQLFLDQSH